MKHLAAYLLLAISGKTPTADDVSGLLKKLGVDSNDEQVATLIKAMEGKKLDDVIKEGTAKLLTVGGSGGGGGGGGASGGAPASPSKAAAGKDDKKKEEKPKEEEAAVTAGDLFGGGGGGKY